MDEAHIMLDFLGIAPYFTFVGAAAVEGGRDEKSQVLAWLLEQTGLPAADAVIVGDTHYDIDAGRLHGLHTVGVLYGVGTRQSLASADTLAESVPALTQLLLNT